MKCPNCGGENIGRFCKFCGSELPSQETPVFVTNNYYGGASENRKEESGCCPKCGSSKIGFKRERVGTNARSTNRKKYVGRGRKGTYDSTARYRTIGLCQSCGYTWVPGSSSNSNGEKSNTVWWVLGWIFIFPVPLMIILLRNKSMNKWLKYGLIALAWLVYAIWIGSAMVKNKKEKVSETNTTTSIESYVDISSESESEETTEALETLYPDNKSINLYVNRYNALNLDYVLTGEDMTKYNHHGTEHNDQIRFFRDDYEIVISEEGSKTTVYVGYIPSVRHTTDEYREMFVRFAKVYAPDLSSDQLGGYWLKVLDGSSITEFEEFECQKSPGTDISYFKLVGEVS